MNIESVLQDLRSKGVQLRADKDCLVYSLPDNLNAASDKALADSIRQNKTGLMEALAKESTTKRGQVRSAPAGAATRAPASEQLAEFERLRREMVDALAAVDSVAGVVDQRHREEPMPSLVNQAFMG